MTLTRHLYVLDEVVSALQTCLRNGWPRSTFWCWELIKSEENDIAFTTLRQAWYLYGGGFDPSIAFEPQPIEEVDWIYFLARVQAAIQSAEEHHAMRYLTLDSHRPITPRSPAPDSPAARAWQWSHPEEEVDPAVARAWFAAMEFAIDRGYRSDVTWLLQTAQPLLSADAIWSALQTLTTQYPPLHALTTELHRIAPAHPVSQILHQTIPLFIATRNAETMTRMLTPLPYTAPQILHTRRTWASWNANVGRRAARINAIPADALHRETTRGGMPKRYSNLFELHEIGPGLLQGCTFWQRVCREFGAVINPKSGALEFPSDDGLEEFYDRWFPDDIPDEWSVADQQKSHGCGYAETASLPLPLEPPIREESLPLEYLRSVLAVA